MTRNYRVYEYPNLPKWYQVFGGGAWFLIACLLVAVSCFAVAYNSTPRVACVEVDRG